MRFFGFTRYWQRILLWCGIGILFVLLLIAGFSYKPKPETIQYGMSFNAVYAEELGLNWEEVYDAFLDDLHIRHLRLAAHWTMVEEEKGAYNFEELDYQIARAEEVGAEVILAVGRRLPRWPECHIPEWANELSREEKSEALLQYITQVVERYKDSPAITYWQVENEPFLELFAFEHCGPLDEELFYSEIELVESLDDSRPILITDSGNLGTWYRPYRAGDAFGTSVYIHFWTPELGQFRTVLPPWFYRLKDNAMQILFGRKETMLIELSTEPWLTAPIVETPLDVQFSRMNLETIQDIITYAEKTRYKKQYLWGGEWWYWLKLKGYPEIWEWGQSVFIPER